MNDIAAPPNISKEQYNEIAEHSESASRLLKAMANSHRLEILCALGSQELSVTELNRVIDLSQSALSQHLAKLRADNLVQTRRESQTIYYRACSGAAQDIIVVLLKHFCQSQ